MKTYLVTLEEIRVYRTTYQVRACDEDHAVDRALSYSVELDVHSEEWWDTVYKSPGKIRIQEKE